MAQNLCVITNFAAEFKLISQAIVDEILLGIRAAGKRFLCEFLLGFGELARVLPVRRSSGQLH